MILAGDEVRLARLFQEVRLIREKGEMFLQ